MEESEGSAIHQDTELYVHGIYITTEYNTSKWTAAILKEIHQHLFEINNDISWWFLILMIYISQAKCGVCYPDCYALWLIPQQTNSCKGWNEYWIHLLCWTNHEFNFRMIGWVKCCLNKCNH